MSLSAATHHNHCSDDHHNDYYYYYYYYYDDECCCYGIGLLDVRLGGGRACLLGGVGRELCDDRFLDSESTRAHTHIHTQTLRDR